MKSKTNLITLVAMAVLLFGIGSPAMGRIIYVDAQASFGGDGSSWTNAYKYLQDALRTASSGEQIYVAQGIYKPDEDRDHPLGTGHRSLTFQLISGVTVVGGYAGYGTPDPDNRNIQAYETILSGDLSDNDPDVELSQLLNHSWRTDNSLHVVKGSGTDETAVLDGFTIEGGNANLTTPDGQGGGMLNRNGSPTVLHCTFRHNSAFVSGGAMCNWGSDSSVQDCKFIENYSNSQGGGIWNSGLVSMLDCTFLANEARTGGAMENWSSCIVRDCTFNGNSALYNGGAIMNLGGMSDDKCSPTITNCIFDGNSANKWGGGMSNERDSSPTVTNCTFHGNSARSRGGGMNNEIDSSPTVTNCTFHGNTAGTCGGGINNDRSSPTLINCSFNSNSAHGGGWGGGGMFNGDSILILTNCTFSGNSAQGGYGGGIYTWDSRTNMRNCILWGDTPDEIYVRFGSAPVITYSYVQGGWIGASNINADPKFADPDGRLSAASPCIDAGDNTVVPGGVTTDLDGNLRFRDDPGTSDTGYGTPPIVDMGAYEFGSMPSCPPPTGVSPTQGPGPGQIVLRWNPPSGATGYRIFYDDDASNPPFDHTQGSSPSSGSDVGNVTQVTISGLPGGEIYYFAVKAYNATCESDYSDQESELVPSEPVEPGVCCYETGDRVRLLVDYPNDPWRQWGLLAGAHGTVLCCDSDDPDAPLFVSWDGWTGGWDKDEYCDIPPGPYPPESGYWVSCDQIAPFTGPRETACCDIPYQVGSRVRLRVSSPRGAAGLVADMLGTVICCDYDDPDLPIFVSWDGWSNGRNSDSYCDTSVWIYPADSGWWMACHEITRD